MRSRAGHLAVGSGSALLGAAVIFAGVLKPGPLAGGVAGTTPLWALFITGGSALSLAGVLIAGLSFRATPAEPDVVPAHVAFSSRMSIEQAQVIPAAARPSGSVSPPPGRLTGVAGRTQGRVAPMRPDIAAIDAQIRELSRQINKAGVMLATGQLSQGGYLEYVEDLKRQRGKLEADRVRAELRSP